jgi:hypothetical protein
MAHCHEVQAKQTICGSADYYNSVGRFTYPKVDIGTLLIEFYDCISHFIPPIRLCSMASRYFQANFKWRSCIDSMKKHHITNEHAIYGPIYTPLTNDQPLYLKSLISGEIMAIPLHSTQDKLKLKWQCQKKRRESDMLFYKKYILRTYNADNIRFVL